MLRSCGLNDGISRRLLVREPLGFKMGSLEVNSEPGHMLRCGKPSEGHHAGLVSVVTQELKKADTADGLSRGPIVGSIMAAAAANAVEAVKLPDMRTPPPIFGIRVVGARWTFLRAQFSGEYLGRLASYSLTPSDRFQVWAWGGPSAAGNDSATASAVSPVSAAATASAAGMAEWGLNFNVREERQQIVRMLVALGHEARELL